MRTTGTAILFVILSTSVAIAQQTCEGRVVPYTVSIAGHTDSASIDDILKAGKIESVNKAFEITGFSFSIGDGNCVGGEGMVTTTDCPSSSFSKIAVMFIKRIKRSHRIFIDCIRAKNKVGQEYLLKPLVLRTCSR